jgi:Flp pilus assembly protein TadD
MSQELWKSYFETGLESAKAGLVETAVDYFEWAAKIKPENHEIQYNLGVSFMTLGHMDDAIKAFTKAINIDGKNSDAIANRAICYAYVDDKKNSERDIKLAAKHGSVEAGIRQAVRLVEEKRKNKKKN